VTLTENKLRPRETIFVSIEVCFSARRYVGKIS
jgi:hypothetical protein